MLKTNEIIDEAEEIMHEKSEEVIFPLSKEDKKHIKEMIKYLRDSQDEKLAEKYDLRPGMGLAAVQVGVLKRYFVISYKEEDETFTEYVVINPKLISHSEELIYAGMGEGCLSVNREVEGIVPRHARITIEYFDEEGNKKKLREKEELAIAIQHEMDHLDGILFTDRIDKNNPYKNADIMREI